MLAASKGISNMISLVDDRTHQKIKYLSFLLPNHIHNIPIYPNIPLPDDRLRNHSYNHLTKNIFLLKQISQISKH